MYIPLLPASRALLDSKIRNVITSKTTELLRCAIIEIILDEDFALISSIVGAYYPDNELQSSENKDRIGWA
ncbi:MAG: hypothetical protein ACFFDV_11220 [Candidatus Thorarchaeota archaeon]